VLKNALRICKVERAYSSTYRSAVLDRVAQLAEQDHTGRQDGGYRAVPSADDVARKWAHTIMVSDVPMPAAEVHDHLRGLTQQLIAALSGTSVDTQVAFEVGARLVTGGFTSAQSLPATFEVLGAALLAAMGEAAPNPPCGPIIELLGALASGYACTLRHQILEQQEKVKRVLAPGWQDIERDRRANEARFRKVLDASPVGIAISDLSGLIIQANRALADILGYSPSELLGRYLNELFSPGDRCLVEEHCQELVTGKDVHLRVRVAMRRADGETIWVQLDGSVLRDAEQAPVHVLTMVEDITNLQLLEQQLYHQTLHDLQTDLPNRQYFSTHLEAVLVRLASSAVITLLYLDLDGFSTINDGLGHYAGDRALNVVARRLQRVVADHPSMVARLGADEFAILIEPSDSALDVSALVETINTELAEPFDIDGTGVALTATIGVVQRQVSECTPEELMRAASITLRRLHGRGKRQWALTDPNLNAAEHAKLLLAAAMPDALEIGQLHVTYQPVVTLAGHRLMGIEASLSWQHPELGVLSHDECVQAAERTGIASDVGHWFLHTAAEQLVRWRQSVGDRVPPLVINLMPSQAEDPDLVATIIAVLTKTALPAAQLEIRSPVAAIRTVAGALAGVSGEQAEDNLRVLTELGVRGGLYDFAGGIGGLRCMAELPISTVRIAPSISRQVAEDPSRILSQAAQALVHIVRGAGIDVVAYPVDSNEQAACWPWIGANWAVGALYGRVEQWLP
jgi:PAS domain S-box-containing protein/diguanylate cyclase (GGDEF)-like protein